MLLYALDGQLDGTRLVMQRGLNIGDDCLFVFLIELSK
jgi:hypothetical protein